MRKTNKLLAILLAVTMTFNTVPVSVLAETENSVSEENIIVTVDADGTANDLSETETGTQETPVSEENDNLSFGVSGSSVKDGQTEESSEKTSTPDDGISIISEGDGLEEVFVMLTLLDGAYDFGEGYLENEDGTIATVTLRTADDFVALSNLSAAAYQNATITIARDKEFDLSGTAFQGLGSVDAPFAGEITIAAGTTSTTPITLSGSLFNGLSQKARIDSNLYLVAADNMTEPLLAADYLKGDAKTGGEISMTVSSEFETDADNVITYSSFGGLIGNMGSGTELSLSIANKIPSGSVVLSNAGNLGFFCNTMSENAKLTIASCSGATDYTITTTAGYAGGLVGYMGDDAVLEVTPEFGLTGNITGKTAAGGAVGGTGTGVSISLKGNFTYSLGTVQATGGNAGGFIGVATDSCISFAPDKKITVSGMISAATNASSGYSAGGFVGNYTYTGGVESANKSLDLACVNMKEATFSSGNHIGGLFGLFTNQSDFTITDSGSSKTKVTTTNTANSNTWQYGGVIGQYIPGNLSDSLTIQNIESSATQSGTVTSFGGLIALVNTQSAYIKIDGVEVTIEGNMPTVTYGGLISEGNDCSHFFDIGTVTVAGDYSAKTAGALVGTIANGVVKLSGTTNISSAKCNNSSIIKGQLIGKRQNAFVYATGNGEDATTWKLDRSSAVAVSDLGDWGEVVRIISDSENGLTGLITEDLTNHTVTISAAESPYTLSTPLQYAQLALAIQLNTASLPTNGALRFADGAPDSLTALAAEISLNSDISMSGTGISEMTRDDGSQTFTGQLHGNNHTLSIFIGQPYGLRNDLAITEVTPDAAYKSEGQKMYPNGSGQIYSHSHLGIFGKAGDVTIDQLTVDGNIYCGQGCVNLYAGAIAGSICNISSNSTLTNVDSGIIIKMPDGTETARIGGYFGMAEQDSKISFTRCGWLSTSMLYSQFSQANDYIGGFLGAYGARSGLSFDNCNIAGTIIRAGYTRDYAYVGGLAAMGSNDSTINITGCTVSPKIKVMCQKFCGGLLGFEWPNTDVTITGMFVKDAVLNTNSDDAAEFAYFGGLVYEASGTWKINKNTDSSVTITTYGIEFSGTNSFRGKSDATITSGLLVCRGDKYNETDNCALSMFIGEDAYKIDGTVSFAGPVATSDYFDEIVGNSISSVTNQNGVVSIATTGHALIDQNNACNTYQKQLSKDYNNPKTRYYYNLDFYNKSDAEITSATELLMWSVGVYSAENIRNNFITEAKDAAVTISGSDLKLFGYSYYPVTPEGSVTINNADIIFAAGTYETVEVSKKPSNQKRQHYMMHAGLLLDVSHDVTVNDLTLEGNILNLEKGSGALVCGTVSGSSSGTTTLKLNSIKFKGIEVYGYEKTDGTGYAPLLINKVSSYTAINMDGVRQEYSMSAPNKIVASSLIGNIGSETACGINLSFLNMLLEAKEEIAVFSNATFMESFQYDINAAASSGGQYTFNKADSYTVGQELSNTENGSVSGRNNGGQYYYYDVDECVGGATEDTKTTFYAEGYLRYVHIQENASEKKYEIDINQRVLHLLKGCGTYGDPFQIEFAGQLSALARCLDGSTNSGWVVQLNPTTLSAQSMTTTHTSGTAAKGDHQYYIYSGGQWYSANGDETAGFTASSTRADSANVITYLRNAYYVITEDMTIGGGSYNGLGSYNAGVSTVSTGGSFSGVIIGKKADGSIPTVTIASPKVNGVVVSTPRFGGLVKYGNGCVIRDINVTYTNTGADAVTISSTAAPVSQKPEHQVFFGGIIGYVIGGDNIIDNVSVSYAADSVKVTGEKSYLANVGGYVGLVGGSASVGTGGGVIFRNLTSNTVALSVNTVNTTGDNNYYYWNPFVGRVLDGFACYDSANSTRDKSSEAVYLQNTDKNYTIPNLVEDTSVSLGQSFKISNAQQAWLLSAIVNSGAGSKESENSTYRYSVNDTAYFYGKTRSGSYDAVGTGVAPDDETFWGGIGYTDASAANKYAYLLTKFVSHYSEVSYAKMLAGTGFNSNYNVTIEADLHLENYLTGFRGIGAGYYSNRDNTTGVRQTFLVSLIGNSKTIHMNVSLDEYSDDTWHLCQLGYYNAIRYNTDISIGDIAVSGTLSLAYHDGATGVSTSGEIEKAPGSDVWLYMGGLIASSARSSSDTRPTFRSVKAENLTVYGGSFVGGIVGGTVTTSTGEYKKFDSIDLISFYYSGLTLHATNAAGGFIGNIVESSTMSVTGITTGANSEIYSDFVGIESGNRGAHDNRTLKYMWGVGGLVGYSRNTTVEINKNSDSGELTLDSVTLQGNAFDYAADFGAGGLIGTVSGDNNNMTANHIKMVNVSVKGYDGTSIDVHTTPFAAALTGGLYGYCRPYISVDVVSFQDCDVLYGGLSGGIAGLANKGIDGKNVIITNCLIYTLETYSYQGCPQIGGMIGYLGGGTATFQSLTLQSTTIAADGIVGGLIATNNTNSLCSFYNVAFKSNKIVSSSWNTRMCWNKENANPKKQSKEQSLTVAVGGFLGYTKGNTSAYNIYMEDNLIGFALDGTEIDADLTIDKAKGLTATNIGLSAKDEKTCKSYSELYSNVSENLTSDSSYISGNIGTLVGRLENDSRKVDAVALCVNADYSPNQLIGTKQNSKIPTVSRIVFADYKAYSASSSQNKSGSSNPYVDVNPLGSISVKKDANTVATTLTGDGVSVDDSKNTIISSIVRESSTYSPLTYSRISSLAGFYEEGIHDYASWSTYLEEEADSIYWTEKDIAAPTDDFPVLVVTTNSPSGLTDVIKKTLSVLTNMDQTSTVQCNGITSTTYGYDGSAWVAKGSDYTIDVSGERYKIPAGRYDNELGQVTILDAKYTVGSYTYHLYIPVLVKKVMQVEFSLRMLTGTSCYEDAYGSTNAILASIGEAFTTMATYQYTWSAGAWNGYISGGASLLWNFDKQLKLDDTSAGSLKSDMTRITLVDANRHGPGNTWYTANGSVIADDATVLFKDIGSFKPVPLCDLLDLNVSGPSADGDLVLIGEYGAADAYPADATIRVWNSETGKFSYYGAKPDGDQEGEYYTIRVKNTGGSIADESEEITVKEVYYLTMNCTGGTDIVNRNMSLGRARLDGGKLPTQTTKSESRIYTVGNFYSLGTLILDTTPELTSGDIYKMAIGSNEYIDVEVTAPVTVSSEHEKDFAEFIGNKTTYLRIAVQMANKGTAVMIDPGSNIIVNSLKVGDTEIAASDYTTSIVNGVYYLTIAQKGSAFINKTVSADLRFSYEGDAGLMASQFPERTSQSDISSGVNFASGVSIAYSENGLNNSRMSGTITNSSVYYREAVQVAGITYNSYNITSIDGNTSQLGINGKEVSDAGGTTIRTQGLYDATQISGLNTTTSTSSRYPYYLIGMLTLQKKTGDVSNPQYQTVKMSDYMSNIVVTSGDTTATVTESGETYTFKLPLTETQVRHLDMSQIEMDIQYFVKSDTVIEALGDVGQYANYKVILSAHLANRSEQALVSDVDDYIIYTNAKFYQGIIGSGDFGKNE